jgi:5-methylcytosine-specific restriction endonuclease McrA
MRGRGLEYWTRDKVNPDPLLLIMAHHGASTDKLRVARDDCWVLCHKCATRRGAKLTKNQTPHLKSYGITVTPDLVE